MLGSRYEVLTELGRGSTGAAYKVRDPLLDRVVAVKMPLPTKAMEPSVQFERLLREARLLAFLTRKPHPHFTTLHEVGEIRGRPFLVREFVDGMTLKQRVVTKAISLSEAARVLVVVARTIQELHEHGFVHRNINPTNILLGNDGSIKLIGFGLVGFLVGSPHLPPEAKGAPAEQDIQALCRLFVRLCDEIVEPVLDNLQRMRRKCFIAASGCPFANAAEFAAELESCLQ